MPEKRDFTVGADDMREAMIQPVVFTHKGVCEYCRKPGQLLANLGGYLVCLACRDGVVRQLKEQLLTLAPHRTPGEDVRDWAMRPAPPMGELEGVVVTYVPETDEDARRIRESHALTGMVAYRRPLSGPRGM